MKRVAKAVLRPRTISQFLFSSGPINAIVIAMMLLWIALLVQTGLFVHLFLFWRRHQRHFRLLKEQMEPKRALLEWLTDNYSPRIFSQPSVMLQYLYGNKAVEHLGRTLISNNVTPSTSPISFEFPNGTTLDSSYQDLTDFAATLKLRARRFGECSHGLTQLFRRSVAAGVCTLAIATLYLVGFESKLLLAFDIVALLLLSSFPLKTFFIGPWTRNFYWLYPTEQIFN